MKRKVGFMDAPLFRRIIDQAMPDLEFVYLHHLGESLVHPRVGEFIAYAKAAGVRTGLSTNANFLDRRRGDVLLQSGLDFLVISLDAATETSYGQMRVGGDFFSTQKNVETFLKQQRAQPNELVVVVQLIVSECNRDEIGEFAREWRERGANVMIKQARDFAGQVNWPVAQTQHKALPCRMPFSELTILWDGRVVPCANVFEGEPSLGSLQTESLDEIWNGEAMQTFRKAHISGCVGNIAVCRRCPGHEFVYEDFVAVDQFEQRLRLYRRDDLARRPGLS